MASDAPILFACADDVATITLNRPGKRNALNEAMWAGLAEAVKRADAMPEAKIVVIRGAGGHFAAGADISEFATVYASRERGAEYSRIVASGVGAIAQAAKPVIAMIEGSCVGGGMAIACADRLGTERGVAWTGGSTIVGADGWVAAETAAVGMIVADVDLAAALDKKYTELADAFGDRRPEMYA